MGDRGATLTPKSSDSSLVALTLGLAIPGFSYWGIHSGLQTRDLVRIRAKYGIPNLFSLTIATNYFLGLPD